MESRFSFNGDVEAPCQTHSSKQWMSWHQRLRGFSGCTSRFYGQKSFNAFTYYPCYDHHWTVLLFVHGFGSFLILYKNQYWVLLFSRRVALLSSELIINCYEQGLSSSLRSKNQRLFGLDNKISIELFDYHNTTTKNALHRIAKRRHNFPRNNQVPCLLRKPLCHPPISKRRPRVVRDHDSRIEIWHNYLLLRFHVRWEW